MDKIILKGRRVVGGVAEGEALATTEYVSGWGGIDPTTGSIIDVRSELYGATFKGKVLVFAGAKGSSGWSSAFHQARLNGNPPAAMVFTVTNSKVALGSAVTRVPAVTDLDQDPTKLIVTGDWVKVDGDNGIVEITKRSKM
jgi:predicted aconitase with swiveling domain